VKLLIELRWKEAKKRGRKLEPGGEDSKKPLRSPEAGANTVGETKKAEQGGK